MPKKAIVVLENLPDEADPGDVLGAINYAFQGVKMDATALHGDDMSTPVRIAREAAVNRNVTIVEGDGVLVLLEEVPREVTAAEVVATISYLLTKADLDGPKPTLTRPRIRQLLKARVVKAVRQ